MEKMLQLACEKNIIVEKFDLKSPLKAIYMHQHGCPPIIGLSNEINNVAEERSFMAEELGHHFTTVGDCIAKEFYHYSARLAISKTEYKALRWAALYLISDDDLLDALREGIDTQNYLAEHFMVTPEIINLRLKLFEKPA